jgi:hypothetical protein
MRCKTLRRTPRGPNKCGQLIEGVPARAALCPVRISSMTGEQHVVVGIGNISSCVWQNIARDQYLCARQFDLPWLQRLIQLFQLLTHLLYHFVTHINGSLGNGGLVS